MNENFDKSTWRWFFVLAALEAGAAFLVLIWVPHTGAGFSVSRLALLAVLLMFVISGIYFTVHLPQRLAQPLRAGYALTSATLALIIATVLFLLRYLEPGRLLIFYQRISPLLIYFFIITVQFSLFVLAFHFGFHFGNNPMRAALDFNALFAFTFLLLVFLFIILTRIGLTPDKAYWGEPGVPLMGWQFGLGILSGLSILLVSLRVKVSSRLDVILPLAIWLLAIMIWLNVPVSVMQNSFYAPMNPPTNQPFPNSDAGYYDSMAQSLLIGYPYLGDIPTRPLYLVLLAFLHQLAGDRYTLIIAGQTFILAIFPVILYFLGKKLHSRAAGVIIALFAIFRELTSLLISSQTRVSNTKTLLVDLPTLLLILVACLFVLLWLERKDRRSGLVAGGMFGVLFLLRTQSMLILPVLFTLVILVFGFRSRSWVIPLVIFLVGIAITISPWLLHNYLKSGQLTIDAPFEYQVVASQYKYTGNLDIQNVDLQGKSLIGILFTFAFHDPKFVLGFIAAHFFATQINGVLALPLIEPYNGLFAPINLYWMTWNGNLSWFNTALIIVYLAFIAIGLGAAWKRLRWIGLVPLAFSLGYSIANGLGRFSGWRYDLPADWISYFYFGIGVAEILAALALILGAKSEKIFTSIQNYRLRDTERNQGLLFTCVIIGVFALAGALPWLAEGLAAPRYLNQSHTQLVTTLLDSYSVQHMGVTQAQIEMFNAAPETTLQMGWVLYPRFFTRNQGLASSHPWPEYAPRDFPRLGFVVINQSQNNMILPTRTIPEPFPSAVDAIILGCRRTDYIEVRLILFPKSDTAYLSTPLTTPCN